MKSYHFPKPQHNAILQTGFDKEFYMYIPEILNPYWVFLLGGVVGSFVFYISVA